MFTLQSTHIRSAAVKEVGMHATSAHTCNPLPGGCSVSAGAGQERKNNREILINNSVTLPSPLRSSAGSRRACRKRDSRGGGGRERDGNEEREREREKSRRQSGEERERGERKERLEHDKPGNNKGDAAGSAKPNSQRAVS